MNEIDITTKDSYIRGFTSHPQSDEFIDYIQDNLYSSKKELEEFQSKLKSFSKVSILCDFWVTESEQGKGKGKALLNKYFELVQAEVIILLLDINQHQRDGFILKKFYQNFGFQEFDIAYKNWMIKYL